MTDMDTAPRPEHTHHPWVTLSFAISLPIITYIVQNRITVPPSEVAQTFGMIPINVTSAHRLWTLLTTGLLHLTQGHLLLNIFILAIAGSVLERRVGSLHVLALTCLGIVCGALAHAFTYPDSVIPLYGVSAGALALAGALVSTTIIAKAPLQARLALESTLMIGALAMLIFNLRLAFEGGVSMPDALVESGVAHGVGFGVGLLYGSLITARRPDLTKSN